MSFLRFLVVLLVACSSVMAKGNDKNEDKSCYKLNDGAVRSLFKKWNDSLKKTPETVLKNYWEHSILLPTLSAMSRTDNAGKLAYFEEFLLKKPSGVIIEDYIVNNCGSSQYRFGSVIILNSHSLLTTYFITFVYHY